MEWDVVIGSVIVAIPPVGIFLKAQWDFVYKTIPDGTRLIVAAIDDSKVEGKNEARKTRRALKKLAKKIDRNTANFPHDVAGAESPNGHHAKNKPTGGKSGNS